EPHKKAEYMTAPDFKPKPLKNALQPGGRPYMTAPDFKPKPLKNALQPGGRPYMTANASP
ncbi:MAG: hypothetical protein ABSE69_15245, partial [Roseiarcus sp.]